jgi:Arc/MetJ family transcription regulator
MRTNIDIDDELLKEAMAATGQSTKRATVEEALRRVVKLHRQKRAGADLAGIGCALPQRCLSKTGFAARAVRAGASVGWRHRIPGSAAWCVRRPSRRAFGEGFARI